MRNSWTRLKVGLVTSSSLAAPRPLMIPLVSVVFPAPRSPFSKHQDGRAQFRRDFPALGDGFFGRVRDEFVVLAFLFLCSQTEVCSYFRHSARTRAYASGSASIRSEAIRGAWPTRDAAISPAKAVQVHSEAEHARPILNAKLRRQSGKNSSQHIASSAGRHSGISCCVDVGMARRRRKNGVKPFEDHVRAPAPRRFQRHIQPPRLHFLHRDPQQTRHFSGMRRQDHRRRAAFVQRVRHPGERVQSVRIQNNREALSARRPRRMNCCVSCCMESPGPMARTDLPRKISANLP